MHPIVGNSSIEILSVIVAQTSNLILYDWPLSYLLGNFGFLRVFLVFCKLFYHSLCEILLGIKDLLNRFKVFVRCNHGQTFSFYFSVKACRRSIQFVFSGFKPE